MEGLIAKLPDAPYGVAAEFQRNVTEPGQDGTSWLFTVLDADGEKTIKASVSGSQRAQIGDVPLESVGALERAVEQAALMYATRGRCHDPLPDDVSLRPDHFR